jgi:hypothetical protein
MATHPTLALGALAQAPLRLGCVGDGEVGEESHGYLLGDTG